MIQTILLSIVFGLALAYLVRFFYRQSTGGKGEAKCDKCLPDESLKNNPNLKES